LTSGTPPPAFTLQGLLHLATQSHRQSYQGSLQLLPEPQRVGEGAAKKWWTLSLIYSFAGINTTSDATLNLYEPSVFRIASEHRKAFHCLFPLLALASESRAPS